MTASMTRVILGAELLALRNRLLKQGAPRLALLVIFGLGAVIFIGGAVFTVGATVGRFLPSAQDSVLAGGFTAVSVLMLVLGFPSVIATFFVGRDLLQLVLAPVRTAELFAARLLLAMTANLLMSGILLAGVIGLGIGSGASAVYYPLAVVLIFVQVLLITAVQAILMSVVLRWVPARLARDVAAAVAGLTGAGFYLAWNVSFRRSFSRASHPDLSNLSSLTQRIDRLPSSWPGHALSAAIAGNAPLAVMWVMATVVLAALVLLAAELLYERTLLAGLGVFGSTAVVWRRKVSKPEAVTVAGGYGSPLLAIARKDWLAYRRDIRRLTRLLPALLFPIGYAIALSQPSRTGGGFWTNVFLAGFMSMFMSTALATPSIPSERRGFQILRMSPVPIWQILRAKVVLTLPPVLALTIAFSVVVAAVNGSRPDQLLELCLLVIWFGCGFVAIGVSAGGIDPRFDANDDRRSVGMLGSLTGVLGSVGFAALSMGAFALFIYGAGAVAGTAHLGPIPSTPAVGALMTATGILLVAGAIAVVGGLLWIASTRLKAFEAPIASTA